MTNLSKLRKDSLLGSYGTCSECGGKTIETPVASECTKCGDYIYYGGHARNLKIFRNN